MIAELGYFSLILALCLAIVQGIIPLAGVAKRNTAWMRLATPASRAQCLMVLIAFICLTASFIQQDFSVLYVATHSNLALPMQYRISAVWGGHEGSLLLWVLILNVWILAITFFNKRLPLTFNARVLAVLGLICVGFLLFIIFTSNPFERLFPVPLDGHDLNPLLQDTGLIFHPPMLYIGYVGLSVPFAFAIAALLEGRIDAMWLRWTRPWTTVAWVFLTIGITWGSWWAYYELGWGGWWFWDPVENASFMPWLIATALIHSLAVTEQRHAFKAWTVLLAIFGFSLSLLGTFLVRSGVLVSVHSFASDPSRGVFILAFLVIVIGAALTLYAWRANSVSGGGQFELMSRETLLLINNVFLVVACGAVLLGTLYPIFLDALNLNKISVGPPYFNKVFVPLMIPLMLILGIGPLTRWKKDKLSRVLAQLLPSLILAVILGGAMVFLVHSPPSVPAMLALMLAAWVMLSTGQTLWSRLRDKSNKSNALLTLPRQYIGMCFAHLGVGIFIVGVTMVSAFEQERHVRLSPGDTTSLATYQFRFNGINEHQGPNYEAIIADIDVLKNDHVTAKLHPEKRYYLRQGNPMTEAGIDGGLTRDLYVSIGDVVEGSEAWSFRIYYRPFIRWLWVGPLLMALGGLLCASDRRYRFDKLQQQA